MNKQIILFTYLSILTASQLQAQNIVGLGSGKEYSYEKLVLKDPLFSKGYLLADDSIQHPLSVVMYYQIGGDYFKRRVLGGGRYEFMYRESEGAIERYSAIRSTTTYNPYTGVPTTTGGKVNFYSKNNEGLKKVKPSNLVVDLADCEMCVQEVKKGKTLSVVSAIGLTAGLAVFIGSAIKGLSNTPEPDESMSIPPGVIIGPILCFTPWFLSGPKQQHYNNAIMMYNER